MGNFFIHRINCDPIPQSSSTTQPLTHSANERIESCTPVHAGLDQHRYRRCFRESMYPHRNKHCDYLLHEARSTCKNIRSGHFRLVHQPHGLDLQGRRDHAHLPHSQRRESPVSPRNPDHPPRQPQSPRALLPDFRQEFLKFTTRFLSPNPR